MLALRIVIVLLLMGVCCFVPGFVLVRKLRWSAPEKICGSIAASLIMLYLASFLIFVLWTPRWSYWICSAVSVGLALLVWRDLWRVVRIRSVRRFLAGYGFLFLWTFALLLFVRTYSGGGWGGDWLEHFHRSLFFLDHLPLGTSFVGLYVLPARPPMMNLLAAFFLAHGGDTFENFSVVSLVLNLLLFFPCALMLPAFARRGSRRIPILMGLLACSPMVMQNATYTWTKSLCTFYVIFGLWLYLAGLRKNDSIRIVAAFISLAAAMLVHYSAAPYLLFLAAHILVRKRWRVALVAGTCAALLFGTWLAWSAAHYGARTTFGSNTTVTTSQQLGDSNARKILLNLRDTIIPHPLRDFPVYRDQRQAGYVRDYFFLMYQTNLIVAMGIAGGFAVLFLFIRSRDVFWLALVPFVVVLGVAVVGERDAAGSAHLTLQPLIVLGLTFLAARFFTLGPLARAIVIVGCVADLTLGVFLQHDLENYENDACAEEFRTQVRSSGSGLYVQTESDIGPAANANWQLKRYALIPNTIRDAIASAGVDTTTRSAILQNVEVQSRALRDQDRRDWRSWWQRHSDRLTLIGDHIGCHVWFLYAFDLSLLAGLIAAIRRQPAELAAQQPEADRRSRRRGKRRRGRG
ncbi:MAG: glycosyltransferase family 39 protein [Acidobacteriota bacterium]|nr:glycosyltransferase family 39 protein [Acidobacteriota bacterium]